MIKVVLLGTGNVATHLLDAFLEHTDIALVQVVGRNKKALAAFAPSVNTTTSYARIMEANVYLIAVSDDAIAEVAKNLSTKKGLVVHTSGAVALNALEYNERRGVFYPLQTFSKGQRPNFKTIPICIEAGNENDLHILTELASKISDNVVHISSKQRGVLHISAVFVNNFTNHCYQLGKEICDENGLPFELLKPLIMETAKKIQTLQPFEAQTGPAVRKDKKTLEKHNKQLKDETHREVYALMSKSIEKSHGEKL
ncbi:Rossmann-like and DUF2520 domain-containing protein [Spongiimicrobium sp. 3-5]|uniref:Rossmann-like and DUF2520 domain-containing protein n=1 Tax=Spongiimicrobium sp. 3-5 TaxID=3332596 RepID=UPI0039817CCC